MPSSSLFLKSSTTLVSLLSLVSSPVAANPLSYVTTADYEGVNQGWEGWSSTSSKAADPTWSSWNSNSATTKTVADPWTDWTSATSKDPKETWGEWNSATSKAADPWSVGLPYCHHTQSLRLTITLGLGSFKINQEQH